MAQDTSAKKANFTSRYVAAVEALLAASDDLITLRLEYDALGYNGAIAQDDLAGANAHLTPQVLADGFASLDALKDLFFKGHLTNLVRFRR